MEPRYKHTDIYGTDELVAQIGDLDFYVDAENHEFVFAVWGDHTHGVRNHGPDNHCNICVYARIRASHTLYNREIAERSLPPGTWDQLAAIYALYCGERE